MQIYCVLRWINSMKIIIQKREYIPPRKRIFVHKCEHCKSIFTYQEEDTSGDLMCGDLWVWCPVCKKGTDIFISRKIRDWFIRIWKGIKKYE